MCVEIQIRKIYCVERAATDASSDRSQKKPGVNNQQRIIIENKHGEKLVGVLHETGSTNIVILCHGFLSSKDTQTIMTLASALENEGISAFRFDFAGTGESEGSIHFGYRREADDLHSVVQHFHGNNRLISAILGHSKGGNVVLLYASKYQDVRQVINVSGRYETKGGVEERLGKEYLKRVEKDGFIDVKSESGEVVYRVTEESLMDRLNTNMHEACLQIDKDCKVLTVHGSSDGVVREEEALRFAKIIPNHKLHIIKDADHGYKNKKHRDELTSIVLSFIKEQSHNYSVWGPTRSTKTSFLLTLAFYWIYWRCEIDYARVRLLTPLITLAKFFSITLC
ncbi:uncharacterized protein [Rutidosis leptorrhynchoides]|uniref:uncharacterized protein n=1 Tax=Rutidosis leptorrhynchoides TaxID=125765 RepID=UPI003A99D258